MEISNKIHIFAPNYKLERMTKRLLSLTFAALLTLAIPVSIYAMSSDPAIELNNERDITIVVQQSTLLVCNAQGETLEIVSLTGNQVMKMKIESPTQRVELDLPKGCYIVKVGKVVRKIAIR